EAAYRALLEPLVSHAPALLDMVLRPPRPPGHPVLLARFGLPGLLPAQLLARVSFREREARALLAGAAAHSLLRLSEAGTGAVALLMLASAHAGGWPLARGGSASVARVMVRRLEELGGEVRCNHQVASVDDLPPHRAVLLDLVPKEVLEVARRRFTPRYRDKLAAFRHGPGVFKLDWTLDAPIPWRSADCARAATVHLGGTMEEIVLSEREVAQGRQPARPFVLLTPPTLFARPRAPDARDRAWASSVSAAVMRPTPPCDPGCADMDWLQAPDCWLTRLVIERALGVIYFVAFLVAVNQFRPLLGEKGLLPVPLFLSRVSFLQAPSL